MAKAKQRTFRTVRTLNDFSTSPPPRGTKRLLNVLLAGQRRVRLGNGDMLVPIDLKASPASR